MDIFETLGCVTSLWSCGKVYVLVAQVYILVENVDKSSRRATFSQPYVNIAQLLECRYKGSYIVSYVTISVDMDNILALM
jgi:hypothetical protein